MSEPENVTDPKQADAPKPNGSVPQTVTVEVPDDLDDDAKAELRKKVLAAVRETGARYVLENDTPSVVTAGALLKQDAEGWPSTILLPTPSGAAVRIALTVSGSVAVAQAERELAVEFFHRINQYIRSSGGPDAELPEIVGRVGKRDEINAWYAESLFDAGVVSGWDEESNELAFNRENFVALASRGAYGDDMVTPFLSGILHRFRQITRPLLEALDDEGEASRGVRTGTRAAAPSNATS